MKSILDIAASIIGYAVIGIIITGGGGIILKAVYNFLSDKFYATWLWWAIHTVRVKRMKLSKMTNANESLKNHRKVIERDCPKMFVKGWTDKIDLKLDELRKEIESHGEVPTF